MTDSAATAAPNRRAELAATAYQLIAERGLDGLSMRVLARAVGATTGLVTHHFLDRAELVSAALDHASLVMNRRAATTNHPRDAIGAVLPTDAETVENWRFVLTIRAAAIVDTDLRSLDAAVHEHWHAYLPDALVKHNLVDADANLAHAVDHLVAVIDGVALRAALEPKKWTADRQLAHIDHALGAIAQLSEGDQ